MFFAFQRSKKISMLENDSVQVITGKVLAPNEIKIPGTDIGCACYWMMTEAWKQPARKKGRKMWMPESSQQGSKGFFVEDATGKVWVVDNADVLELRSGWENSGRMGKKGTKRFVSRCIKSGDVVKIRGLITPAKGAEPGDCKVVRPNAKGMISILLRKKSKQ
ncbi:MAG: hypothetical protein JXR76_24445 [Deltaproteobacteria bacterium]|nr:hypothetical protein [Deltaproteobacteria bacterium]